jgi:hypothetical protein
MNFTTEEIELLGDCIFITSNNILFEMMDERDAAKKQEMKDFLQKLYELERKVQGK